MKFLHRPFKANPKDVVVVEFSAPTKILLLHRLEFNRYKKGRTYRYRGGFAEKSPVEFTIPAQGTWHVVIEKGTYKNPLEVTGSAKLIPHHYDTLNGMEQLEGRKKSVTEYDDTLD